MNEQNRTGLGWLSLITGILGFFVFGIILGIVALITGILSWETKIGKAGFVIGIIDVVGVLIFFS